SAGPVGGRAKAATWRPETGVSPALADWVTVTSTGVGVGVSTNPCGTTERPDTRILAGPVVDTRVTSKAKRVPPDVPDVHCSSAAPPTVNPLLTKVDTVGAAAKVSSGGSVIWMRPVVPSAPTEFSSMSMLPSGALGVPTGNTKTCGTDTANVVVPP